MDAKWSNDRPSDWLRWEWQEEIWRQTRCNPSQEQAQYIINEYGRYLKDYDLEDCYRTALSLIHEHTTWFEDEG